MSHTTNGNNPAFPNVTSQNVGESLEPGMTKREYFAAMAMQGILANYGESLPKDHLLAEWSVDAADALLNQLEK